MNRRGKDPANPYPIFEQFGDFFSDFFDAGANGQNSPDLTVSLELTLEEASEGTQKQVEAARFFGCEDCDGRGALKDATVATCGACDGKRQKVLTKGFFQVTVQCDRCRGKGELLSPPCATCDGLGGETKTESFEVQVPAGVIAGQKLRLLERGNDLRDGDGPGHLYIALHVAPHERLSRVDNDLITTVEVPPEIARDGGEVAAPVPGGTVSIPIAAGMDSGTEIRLPGYGAVKFGSPVTPRPTGDHVPYRSVDPSMHRGDLIVYLVLAGERIPLDRHYATLGLSTTASDEQIKQAYRQRAVQLHPDRNPDDPIAMARFAELNVAYGALTSGKSTSPVHRTDRKWQSVLPIILIALGALVVYQLMTM